MTALRGHPVAAIRHIAVIPARKGSAGFKFKNRLLFPHTADFLDDLDWMNQVIVSTDDPVIEGLSSDRGYTVLRRPAHLSGGAVSIKAVFEHLVAEVQPSSPSVLWLFYVPMMYRSEPDFLVAKRLVEKGEARSVCTFIRAKTHPFDTWSYDTEQRTLAKYIDNDVFRRQDKPDAWEHYHYVCCLFADEVDNLNSELIGPRTHPVFLDDLTASRLVEVDAPEDLKRWESMQEETQTAR